MSGIEKKIIECRKKSLELKRLYLGNDKIPFEKCKEIQNQQNEEYMKMMFFKNLKREMNKNDKNFK